MEIYKEKLNELITHMNDFEIAEVVDFAEFINKKRKKIFDDAFSSAEEVEENLSAEEIKKLKESSSSDSVPYEEMWGN